MSRAKYYSVARILEAYAAKRAARHSKNFRQTRTMAPDSSEQVRSDAAPGPSPATRTMNKKKNVALVAHDNKKPDLLDWAEYNRKSLAEHNLYATGTTGRLLQDRLGFSIKRLQSGPLGGDQQLGARIAEGEIDVLIFFWDPLEPMPHDPDVKALLRIAAVWNVPIACTRATADFLFSSPLMQDSYERPVEDLSEYQDREVDTVQSEAPAEDSTG